MEQTQDSKHVKKPVSLLAIFAFSSGMAGIACIVWAFIASETFQMELAFSFIVVSALFAVFASIRIRKSARRPRGMALVYAILPLVILFLFSIISNRPYTHPLHIICKSHMRAIGIVFQLYAEENDSRLPTASSWCDLISPYIDSESWYQCPSDRNARCSYALNKNLPAKLKETPPDMVVLFESPPGWNQTGSYETAVPDRHKKGSNILFANGRVELVKPAELPSLQWTPAEAAP